MDLRKVQEMGGGTLLISLPKDWARKNRISKGSVIAVEAASGDSLIIHSLQNEEKRVKEIGIPYPAEYMARLINAVTGAYLLGFDVIRVHGRERITYDDREMIKKAIRQLVGLEIVEEDASSITTQFLLEPTTLDPEKILRRMHMITNGMHRDAITSLLESDMHLMRIVIERDDEVDRLYFLLVRLIRSAVQDARLASRFRLSSIDCLDYRVAANVIEAIGDVSVEVAKVASILPSSTLDDDIKGILKSNRDLTERMQEASVKAFLTRGAEEAKEVLEIFGRLTAGFGKLEALASKKPLHIASSLLGLAASMSRIARYSIDIADLAVPMYPILR